MKRLSLFAFLLLAILFVGCEKDVIGEQEMPIVIPTDPVEIKLGDISGIVFDENNNSIENAIIKYNRESYSTDENGFFKIPLTAGPADGALLLINKDGYFDNFKFVFLEAQKTAHTRIQLIEKNNPTTINGVEGTKIDVEGGGSVTFAERSFIDNNNVSYEGDVTIYTHWFDPTSKDLIVSMPGDLRGINKKGQIQQLTTFGMMAVELYGSNGQKLNLAEGKTAIVEFPIPESIQANAPDEIITWSLNEETAYWEEESIALMDNGMYSAEVTHFSFWNCDIPEFFYKLRGRVINESGAPLPWYRICVRVANSNETGGGYTNSDGRFCGWVPKDKDLIVMVKDECGNSVYTQDIGSSNIDKDLGEIEVRSEGQRRVSGSLRCNGEPITDGYALLTLPNGVTYIAETDEDGKYSIIVEACSFSQITIQGIDIANERQSGIVTQDVSSLGEVNIIPFEVCQEIPEFIRYKIGDSEEELLNDPSAKIIDGNLTLVDEELSQIITSVITIVVPNAVIGDNDVESIRASIVDQNNSLIINGTCGIEPSFECIDVTLNIDNFGGVGDLIEGTFMGEVYDQNGDPEIIMGSFKVILDLITESSSISGLVWSDDNEDGIRQGGELPLEGVGVSLLLSDIEIQNTVTDVNGMYRFDEILRTDVALEIDIESGFQLTLADQGSDDTVDSDFTSNPEWIALTSGSEINNFDAGIHEISEMTCRTLVTEFPDCPGNDPFASVTVMIERGTPPFQVFFNSDLVETSNDREIEVNEVAIGDVYSYTVTDTNGESCQGEFSLEIIDSFGCIVQGSNATNGNDNGIAYVIGLSDLIESVIWNNGSTQDTITDLAPGTYSVTATSINGCTTECDIVIEDDNFSCEIIGPNVICNIDFDYDLEVESNLQAESFIWSTGQVSSGIVVSPDETTNYSVTITNGGLSTSCDKTITINNDFTCSVSSTDTQCGLNNGSAIASASGGTPPYSYAWSNGTTTSTITNLNAGTYFVTVFDSVGCSTECSVVIEVSNGFTCLVNTTNASCGQSNGSATVSVNNGSGNYSYAWNNGSSDQEIADLLGANYSVTVTDNVSGCTSTCSGTVEGGFPFGVEIVTNQECNDQEWLTEVNTVISNPNSNYTYLWTNGLGEPGFTTFDFGIFTVTVTDSQGCTATASVEVTPSSSRIGDLVWIDNINGQNNVYDQGIDEGAPNVPVILYDAIDPMNLVRVDSTLTNSEGWYSFENLTEGSYVLGVELPQGFTFVEKDILDDFQDSDVNENTGLTDIFTLDGCEENFNIDAGIKED